MDPSKFHQKKFYENYLEAIRKIYQGESLWESVHNEMIELRKYVNENWLTITTNTHFIERWVKYCNECTFNTTAEGLAEDITILRSTTIFHYRQKSLRLSQERVLTTNQHWSGVK